MQGFFTKVTTVIENLIVAGEGDELVGTCHHRSCENIMWLVAR